MATDPNRARLTAQALGGASGLRAFEDAQRDMTTSRAQATQAALERARNPHTLITGAQQREIERIVGGAYDPAMASASQGHTTMNRHAGSAEAAQAAYAASVGQHGSRASMMRAQEAASRARQQQAAAAEAMRYGGYQTAGEYENAARGGGEMLAAAHQYDAARDVQSAVNERELARQAQSYEGRARREADRMDQRAAQEAAQRRVAGSEASIRAGAAGQMRSQVPRGYYPVEPPATPRPSTVPQIPVRYGSPSTEGDTRRAAAVAAQDRALEEYAYASSPQALAALTRQFAVDYLLGDPLDAMGRFPVLTEQQIMQNAVDMAELTARFEDVMNYGPGGEAAAINAAVEQMTGGMDASSLASSLGLTEATVAAVASTDMFQQALEAAFPQPTDSLDDAYARAAQVIRSVPAQDAVVAALITEIIDAQMPGFRTAFREEGTASAYDAFSRARGADIFAGR